MRSVTLVLLCLALATLACSLGGGGEDPTPVSIINRTAIATLLQTPGVTPSPTLLRLSPTPDQFSGSTTGGAAANCVIRSDWAIYIVVAGDTLGIIGERTGSNIAELVSGNCLDNPDAIFVGQQLRVPRLPAAATASASTTGSTTGSSTSGTTGSTTSGTTGSTTSGSTTSSGGNTAGGSVAGAPILRQEGLSVLPVQVIQTGSRNRAITLQPDIALDIGVVMDADTVRYYAGETAIDTSPVNIATDIDPYDGTRITYTFNDFDPVLYFWAVAENDKGATTSNMWEITYDPLYGVSGDIVSITPYRGFDGHWYTLSVNSNVTLSWQNAPTNATRVEFYIAPSGTGTTPVLIGTDSTPADGASMSWTAAVGTLGTLNAIATLPDGTTRSSQNIQVYVE